jgi:hypothetical protein
MTAMHYQYNGSFKHASCRWNWQGWHFMNDTGWVTDSEDPAALAIKETRRQDFQPPLDCRWWCCTVMDPCLTVSIQEKKQT